MKKLKWILLGAALVAVLVLAWSLFQSSQASKLTSRAFSAAQRDTLGGYAEAAGLMARAVRKAKTEERSAALAWFVGLYALRGGPDENWQTADATLVPLDRLEHKPRLGYAARALVLLANKRAGDALIEITHGLQAFPGAAELLWVQARAELALEKPRDALATLQQAMDADSGFVPARYERAMLLFKRRALKDDAVELLDQIVARSPMHPAALALAELALAGKGDRAAAGRAIDQLLLAPSGEIAPADAERGLKLHQQLQAAQADKP